MVMTANPPIEQSDIDEALALVDRFLAETSGRTLVPQGEVADFALDLRLILSPVTPGAYNDT